LRHVWRLCELAHTLRKKIHGGTRRRELAVTRWQSCTAAHNAPPTGSENASDRVSAAYVLARGGPGYAEQAATA
jgi:hypothetical protein